MKNRVDKMLMKNPHAWARARIVSNDQAKEFSSVTTRRKLHTSLLYFSRFEIYRRGQRQKRLRQ